MEYEQLIDRLDWIIKEYYDGKPKRFTDAMKISPSNYSAIKAGSLPNSKLLISIKEAHPNISLDWLLVNEGPPEVTNDKKLIEKNRKLRKAVSELMEIIKES